MQSHESMNVALCLIEDGEWAKAGSTAEYLYHSHRLAREGTKRENWLLSGEVTSVCPPRGAEVGWGNIQVPRRPMGKMWDR